MCQTEFNSILHLKQLSVWDVSIIIHVIDSEGKSQLWFLVTLNAELGDSLNKLWKKKAKKYKYQRNVKSNIYRVDVFSSFCAKCFIFLLHSSLLLIPLSLISVVTSCIHEFRGLPFLLLPGGHYSKLFRGTLSSSILCMWQYQFNCLYLI